MRDKLQVKEDLLAALASESDAFFLAHDFKRRKGSLEYIRSSSDVSHAIFIGVDYFPSCEEGAEVHIHPVLRVGMSGVSEAALALVDGNKMLLANAPELIVAQPVEFAAPKDEHRRWFASGGKQIARCIQAIVPFVEKWAFPLFNSLSGPVDLISLSSGNDARLLKQKHWYIFVAAAYTLTRDFDGARSVLEANLGAPGLRRRYASAFENVDALQ